jgi:hypothetical protein
MRRSLDAAIEAQRSFLPAVIDDRLLLNTRRGQGDRQKHLALYNHPDLGFCGAALVGSRESLYFSRSDGFKLCQSCREVLDSLLSRPVEGE